MHQFDVKLAFLNGELKQDVYIAQPKGFIVEGKEEKVYKLRKALCGLKQAPWAWYSKIDSYFHENEFQRSMNEPNLYVKRKGNNFLIICLYVDDMIYLGSISMINEFKASMKREFEMANLGELQYFLGLKVKQCEDGIFICQQKYATELLKRFNLLYCKITATPMNLNEKLQVDDGNKQTNEKQFRSLVGGLIYLTHTRLDMAFLVGVISRFMLCPSKTHFGVARRVL